MIALTCRQCGHSIEVSDSLRGQTVRCARCGQMLEPVSSSAPSTEIGTPILDVGGESEGGDFGLTFQGSRDETPSPRTPPQMTTFPFLAPPLAPGEIGWLGHYRVERLLGQGGMGIVFEAVDTHLQRPVALKVMNPDVAKDELARQRFLREARVTAKVRSDHVVVIHQVGQHQGVPFLAMEFLHGMSLDRWLEGNGRPPLKETLRIGIEIARGLVAAHDLGLIHRDIKPGNIWLEMLNGNPDASPVMPIRHHAPFRVKILDFGLARILQEKVHLTHSGLVLGTPAYMAPEQAEGAEVDARCDLFSLGCVLYELATGARPFVGSSTMALLMAVAMKDPLPPEQLNPELPPAFSALILRLLAKKPHDRPASARATVDALEAIAGELGRGVKTPPGGIKRGPLTTMAMPPLTPARRRKLFAGVLALAAVLAVGLAAWLLFALMEERDEDIVLGMSGPFSGPSKELGREMRLGSQVYLRHINDQGGVHGHKLRLVALDDGYEPEQALANMKELHEQRKVFAMIGNVGTPTAETTVPYAIENKVLMFGAFTGAKILRKSPPDRYVFNYRASLEEETAAVIKYLVDIHPANVRPEQIAVFAQNDGFGNDGYSGAVKVLREVYRRDPKDILRVGYERNTIQVDDAVEQISKRADLRAVVMVASYKPAIVFIHKIRDARPELILTNVAFVGSEALADGLRELGPQYVDGVIVTQVVPPIDSHATIVLNYHEQRTKYFPSEKASFTSLEGYISAALFVEGVKRAGRNPTPEKVIDALETIRDFDMGIGAALTFTKDEHQASHKVWASVLDKQGNHRVLDLTQ